MNNDTQINVLFISKIIYENVLFWQRHVRYIFFSFAQGKDKNLLTKVLLQFSHSLNFQQSLQLYLENILSKHFDNATLFWLSSFLPYFYLFTRTILALLFSQLLRKGEILTYDLKNMLCIERQFLHIHVNLYKASCSKFDGVVVFSWNADVH